jgi:hypothetical protein
VLVALSEGWLRRFEGTESPTVGAGAAREADALMDTYDKDRNEFARKVILVVLPNCDTNTVPSRWEDLRGSR